MVGVYLKGAEPLGQSGFDAVSSHKHGRNLESLEDVKVCGYLLLP